MSDGEPSAVQLRESSPDRLSTFKVTPDLVVFREKLRDDGTPEIVLERLKDMRKKEEIERMWREERSATYIPFTEEGRKMKLAAKLRNRIEAKHAHIVSKGLQQVQKAIELDFDAVEYIKEDGGPVNHGETGNIWKALKDPLYIE